MIAACSGLRGATRLLAVIALAAACGTPADKRPEPSATQRPDSAADAGEQHLASLSPEQWLGLSLSLYQRGRYLESIGAAQSAAYLRPNYAEAYLNIGAAYAALHMWDQAIQSAQTALRLRPDLTLARNNLAWALQQKQLGVR